MLQRCDAPVRNWAKYATVILNPVPADWATRDPIEHPIFLEACWLAQIGPRDVTDPSRVWDIAYRRQYVYYLLRLRNWSYPRIAQITNRKDHTTVIYGVGRFKHVQKVLNENLKSCA